jgi:hypothetical protein
MYVHTYIRTPQERNRGTRIPAEEELGMATRLMCRRVEEEGEYRLFGICWYSLSLCSRGFLGRRDAGTEPTNEVAGNSTVQRQM